MKEDKNISHISHYLTFECFDMSFANCWKQTNKQTIDSNAVSKVFNGKRWTGKSWRHLLILWKWNIFTYVLDTWHSFFQLCVGGHDVLWLGVTFFGWVWLSVAECDLFLAGCGWVWVSVTFFGWVWVGVGECGWMWVSARFITARKRHLFKTW